MNSPAWKEACAFPHARRYPQKIQVMHMADANTFTGYPYRNVDLCFWFSFYPKERPS
jgi:hypothetical protein